MKICSKCKIEKELDKFFKNKMNCKDGHSAWCKKCQLEHKKIHYINNKDKYSVSSFNSKKWFIDLKIGLKCINCGFNHPAALDFHHVNPKEKLFPINYSNFGRKSRGEILKEIEKCIVLCSNCHRIEHSIKYNEYIK